MPSAPDATATPLAVQRMRLAVVCLGLTLLTFAQSAGLEAADTKLDLVVSPLRFLRNALRMWDPTAAAGQMQDQAYGYLFPMGPVFMLGKLAALPAWVVQRGWESALLVAAFLGVVRLARLLGVPGFWPRVGAALAYALAPRVLMELGVISAELLPAVVLPWVLIPIVRGATEGSPRRAAAASGVALAFAGGVNAAATVAVLPVPVLWLLTRARGPRRRALMVCWVSAVVLACLWWIVPLLVLGRYSPPFLDWIESSTVTTGVTNLVDVLRGADHWQAFLGPGEWPGGWILVAAPATVLATTVVAALGLAGLGRAATPHRSFLVWCVALGVVLVTLGHVGAFGPPFAGTVRVWLDGGLNAFRNVHKFDPVLRLPIAIGVGHALAAMGARLPAVMTVRSWASATVIYPRLLATIAVVGIAAVAISPALTGDMVPRTRTVNEPFWWTQVGTWLGEHDGAGRALVVPGAAQPAYVWGSPRDDALQPVADGPWAVRDSTPLAQPGYIRLLDAVESVLAAGRADAGLAQLLGRAGMRYLVVRNDLDTSRSASTPLRFVRATIANSPGWREVARFGPDLTPSGDPNRLTDLGLTRAAGAVTVYENAAWSGPVALLPARGVVVANGSSDVLPQLEAAGLPARTPVVFGVHPDAFTSRGIPVTTVLTDGIRKREFAFGAVDSYSGTMSASQPYTAQRAAHDYLPEHAGPLATVTYQGVSDVRASSSGSDGGGLHSSAADTPWAALDDDPNTAWRSASLSGAVGQWLEVDLPEARQMDTATIAFAPDSGSFPSRVLVTTDRGSLDEEVAPQPGEQQIRLPGGRVRKVRVTVLALADRSRGARAAISSVRLPGVVPSRSLTVPGSVAADVISFRGAAELRSACLSVNGAAACDPSWAAAGEEDAELDRRFTLARPADFEVAVGVRLTPGPRLDALLDAGSSVKALASSNDSADPRERAGAAVDGDPRTGWVAKAGDSSPTLALTLPGPRLLDRITLLPITGAPVTVPTRVLVHVGQAEFSAPVDNAGEVRFPQAYRAASVTITVLASTLRVSTDSLTFRARQLPVGIGEVRFDGENVQSAHQGVVVDCANAVPLMVDGTPVAMTVHASSTDVLAGNALPAVPCNGGLTALSAGPHHLRFVADGLMAPVSITLERDGSGLGSASPATVGEYEVQHWSATKRSVRVRASDAALLVVRENANAGWHATLRGRTLEPVTVDGWQQGWLLPAGTSGSVVLAFGPQRSADLGLLVGAIAAMVLVAGAVARSRRAGEPAVSAGVLPRWVLSLVGVVALTATGSLAGLVVALVALVVSWLLPRARRVTPALLAAGALAVAGLAEAAAPAGSARPLAGAWGVQLLCLVALALLLVPTPLRRGAPRAAEASQDGSFDDVP